MYAVVLLLGVVFRFVPGYTEFANDIEKMVGRKPFLYFRICWCAVSPVLISVSVSAGAAWQSHVTG